MALPNLGAVNETLEVHDHSSAIFHDAGVQHSGGTGSGYNAGGGDPEPGERVGGRMGYNPDTGKISGESYESGGGGSVTSTIPDYSSIPASPTMQASHGAQQTIGDKAAEGHIAHAHGVENPREGMISTTPINEFRESGENYAKK